MMFVVTTHCLSDLVQVSIYTRQASLPKRSFFGDDDDPDQTDEDNDGWYKDAWYEKAGVKEDQVHMWIRWTWKTYMVLMEMLIQTV